MTDSLGHRFKVGVVVPSTNTSCQPEMDALRVEGVTNHISRMFIRNDEMVEKPGFDHVMHAIRASTEPALESLITCDPDHLVIGVSPESYWQGAEHHSRIAESMMEAGGGRPVTMSPDAVIAALRCYDARRIAIVTPYLPVGEDPVSRFFTDVGFDVVRITGLNSPTPAEIAHVSEDALCEAIRNVDGPDVEAIVQVGTNVAMARVATVAEKWLGKPALSNNVVLYWHALRSGGVNDPVHGFGSLLSNHLVLPAQLASTEPHFT